MGNHTSLQPGTTSIVALTGTSAQSAALGTAGAPSTQEIVRVCATADAWLTVGSNPTAIAANAASFLLPAGVVEYIDVKSGDKIAGILASGTGTLSVTVCLGE